MAQPTIISQSSPEQLERWADNFKQGRWIGCYAQTELAHGSNLSRLQTTATLDRNTDEWVINSPTPEDGKFWIGSGKTATHAIVQANLSIPAKDGKTTKAHGMHPILVPLRSTKDYKVLPGRKIMDVGPKLGSNTMVKPLTILIHLLKAYYDTGQWIPSLHKSQSSSNQLVDALCRRIQRRCLQNTQCSRKTVIARHNESCTSVSDRGGRTQFGSWLDDCHTVCCG